MSVDIGELESLWGALEAATETRTPFTLGYLGTVGAAGEPRVRAVILREVDGRVGTVAFATDARTAKVQELARDPRVAITFYDPDRDVQLRLEGTGEIVRDADTRRAAWDGLGEGSKRLYDRSQAPATSLAEVVSDGLGAGEDAAFERFAWIRVTVDALDAIDLSGVEHARCLHSRRSGHWASARLVP